MTAQLNLVSRLTDFGDQTIYHLNAMKDSFQILYELGVAACVVVVAMIAIILMVSHAIWKSVASVSP